jgi:KaiC/GvpD/RAD55 family RecA-like ATPase
MKYSPASVFHEGKMIEIQRVMEKLRVDLEYHEQKIRLIKYEMVQIDLSEISVCSTSSYTVKDVEFHEDKIREVIKELKKNEKLLSDEIERMAMSQRAFDDERRNQL